MAQPPCLSGPPHVGPGPRLWGQRTQACLCSVFSLESSPASAPHPPWGAWRLSRGLRGGAVTWAVEWPPEFRGERRAWILSPPAARPSQRHQEVSAESGELELRSLSGEMTQKGP